MNPQNKQPRVTTSCVCGKEIVTTQKRIDSGRGKYCSQECKYEHRIRPKFGKGVYKLVKDNPTSFKKGHKSWLTGTKGMVKGWSKGTKGLVLANSGSFSNGMKPWNKGIEHIRIQGENHHNWKGDNIGYAGVHSWIHNKAGKANKCEKCDGLNAKRFEWHNISMLYKRDLSDWVQLCTKCHKREHRILKSAIA